MSGNKTLFLTSLVASLFLFVAGCGESDSGSASAPAPAPTASEAATASEPAAMESESSGFDVSTIEKAEGVVYQDEIYANWPYN